ncbi:hypothetical protein SGPA1_40693 [Streptomyces misionensis JCM 4497]
MSTGLSTSLTSPSATTGPDCSCRCSRSPPLICALTRDNVLDDRPTLQLRLGTRPVEIPPPLDGMIRELVHHPFGKAHRLDPVPSPWLFPGSRTGRSMEPVSPPRRLKALGIQPRPTRNAWLMGLAAEPRSSSAACSASVNRPPRTGWPRAAATTPPMPPTGPPARSAHAVPAPHEP